MHSVGRKSPEVVVTEVFGGDPGLIQMLIAVFTSLVTENRQSKILDVRSCFRWKMRTSGSMYNNTIESFFKRRVEQRCSLLRSHWSQLPVRWIRWSHASWLASRSSSGDSRPFPRRNQRTHAKDRVSSSPVSNPSDNLPSRPRIQMSISNDCDPFSTSIVHCDQAIRDV
jgi:hypothetical protein